MPQRINNGYGREGVMCDCGNLIWQVKPGPWKCRCGVEGNTSVSPAPSPQVAGVAVPDTKRDRPKAKGPTTKAPAKTRKKAKKKGAGTTAPRNPRKGRAAGGVAETGKELRR